MKRIILAFIVAMLASLSVPAQTEVHPKGLYRLHQFIFEDGRKLIPAFTQYKYAADSVGLLIICQPSKTINSWNYMTVEIREPYPLLNTGEKPQGADGHGTQVFNVDDIQFSFKWYNDRWPQMSELNEFITEVYAKVGISKEMTQAFNMLENKFDSRANKFTGWWMRIGAAANPDGTGKRTQVPTLWKAYSPKLSMVVTVLNNGKVLGCNTTNTVKYDNDSTIHEVGHPCKIHWLSDDRHTLTFVQENGEPLTEIWVRSGLPQTWQNVFNTSVPWYKDGIQCIIEAVTMAVGGDMNKAEELIAEATSKDVPMPSLCEGVVAIATNMFENQHQYSQCKDFCEKQLLTIKTYADKGHDHDAVSNFYTYFTEMLRALSTYRGGDQLTGKKLMEDHIGKVTTEIDRYKTVRGMENYVSMLYSCNMIMHDLGYDVFGADPTLLYLDVLTLVAPDVASQHKPLILNCRANCYLLKNDKETAEKLWKEINQLDPNFMKKRPDDDLLKKTFSN